MNYTQFLQKLFNDLWNMGFRCTEEKTPLGLPALSEDELKEGMTRVEKAALDAAKESAGGFLNEEQTDAILKNLRLQAPYHSFLQSLENLKNPPLGKVLGTYNAENVSKPDE